MASEYVRVTVVGMKFVVVVVTLTKTVFVTASSTDWVVVAL